MHVAVQDQKYLTIGSLVTFGSVLCGKSNNIGIIIGVDTYNFGISDCVFLVYANEMITKTTLVFLME